MGIDSRPSAVSREEFDRLRGQVLGLTNAIRALLELVPDQASALAAVQHCFETEETQGQSDEYIGPYQREGLEEILDELKQPIRHDWVTDSDPEGLIRQAEVKYAARQAQMNSVLMAKLETGLSPSARDESEDPKGS